MDDRRRGLDVGGLMFGAILLFVGGYFLLRNTLGWELPEIDWDMVWPVVIIAIGVAILLGALARARSGGGSGTRT